VKDASVIHFHGHCDFDKTNALRQRLILARGGDETVHVDSTPPIISLQNGLQVKEQLLLLSNNRDNAQLLEGEPETLSVWRDSFTLP
jgi:hypothetical protein